MFNRKGEISTIVILGTLVIIGIGALMSATINQDQRTLDTRAEFDGTSCNDNIGDSLNTSGSTNFNINCWGNLNRSYTYALFWCPEQSKGAAYCGDIRDIEGSKKQATLLDKVEGAVLPSTLNKSTDKNCGCVSWHVGVQDANGQIGWAGSAGFCSNSPCDSGNNTQPTIVAPTQVPPTSISQTVTSTPIPTRVPTYTQQNDEFPPTKVPTYSQQRDEYPPTPTSISTNVDSSQTQCSIALNGFCVPDPIECVNFDKGDTDNPQGKWSVKGQSYGCPNQTSYCCAPNNNQSNSVPTPVPTVVRTEQIQTQNDTIFKACFDENRQIILPLPSNCISESWEDFLRYLDSL